MDDKGSVIKGDLLRVFQEGYSEDLMSKRELSL